jgi:hypothetical protein
MATIRKKRGNWQCMIRVINHPNLSKTFKKHEDAKRWGNETELKIRREDAGIVKIKFPSSGSHGAGTRHFMGRRCQNNYSM